MRRKLLSKIVCPWPWWENSPASGAIVRKKRKGFAQCYFLDSGEILSMGDAPTMLVLVRKLRVFGFRKKHEFDLTKIMQEAKNKS